MKENFEVNLKNLTREERKTFLKLIERSKKIPEISEKRCRSKNEDEYYYIANDGEILLEHETGCKFDELNFQFGNYFKTIDEADFARKKQFTYQQLSDYALEHNTEAIDWKNPQQNKWFIGCNHNNNTLITGVRQSVEFINTVYFTSREIAENAIKEIGEDKIKYYLFGIE